MGQALDDDVLVPCSPFLSCSFLVSPDVRLHSRGNSEMASRKRRASVQLEHPGFRRRLSESGSESEPCVAPQRELLTLGIDVLTLVLRKLPVQTVIQVESVCKYFQELASAESLWRYMCLVSVHAREFERLSGRKRVSERCKGGRCYGQVKGGFEKCLLVERVLAASLPWKSGQF